MDIINKIKTGIHHLVSLRASENRLTRPKNGEKIINPDEIKNLPTINKHLFQDIIMFFDASGKLLKTIPDSKEDFFKVLGKELYENILENILKKAIKEEILDFEYIWQDKIFRIKILSYFCQKNVKTFLVIISDISLQRKTELQNLRLATAVEQSANIIVITDLAGNIQYVNPSFTRHTGYTAEEVMNTNTSILNAGKQPKEVYQDLWQTITSGKTWKGEFCNKKKNGEIYWESTLITPVKDENQQIISYIAIKEDITLQKALNEKIEKQQKELEASEKQLRELNAAKDKFFSIIGHDLKNPLNTLLGFSTLLSDNYKYLDDEKKLEYIGYIRNSSEQGLQLLINLLDWARSQTNKIEISPSNINPAELTDNVFALLDAFAARKQITLINEIPANMTANADKEMINTVLRNLVSNAIKYTPINGSVNIKAVNEEDEIKITVTDTGVGMDSEKLQKLFRLDQNLSTPGTEKEKGTGLGLILCKEFIEKNHGKIWAESSPGQGSSFIFTLPASKT